MFRQCGEMCAIFNFISVFLTEFDDLHEVFFWQYRTCAVHYLPCSWLDEVQTLLQDYFLYFCDLVKPV